MPTVWLLPFAGIALFFLLIGALLARRHRRRNAGITCLITAGYLAFSIILLALMRYDPGSQAVFQEMRQSGQTQTDPLALFSNYPRGGTSVVLLIVLGVVLLPRAKNKRATSEG
jgi:hypothetical protein